MDKLNYEIKFDNKKYISYLFENFNSKTLKISNKSNKSNKLSRLSRLSKLSKLSKLTKSSKLSRLSKLSKLSKLKKRKFHLFEIDDKITLNKIYNFYEKEFNITNKKLLNFFDISLNIDYITFNSEHIYGILPLILYHYISIFICGNTGNYFSTANILYKNHNKVLDKILNDKYILPTKIKYYFDMCNEFINRYIKTSTNGNKYIEFNNFSLMALNNSEFISNNITILLIDVINRYYKNINDVYNNLRINIYFTFNENVSESIITDTNKMSINMINSLNYFEIIKIPKIYDVNINEQIYYKSSDIINDNYDFILIFQRSVNIYNNTSIIEYIKKKLVNGGNLILFLYETIPICSTFIAELTKLFNNTTITNINLRLVNNWCFIGKNYIGNSHNIDKLPVSIKSIQKADIQQYLDNAQRKYLNVFEQQQEYFATLNNIELIRNEKKIIRLFQDRYVEIYRWFKQNNLPVINIFQEKEPQLLSKKEISTYYFPLERGVDRSKLEMTDISIYSITLPQEAELISQTILYLYRTFFTNCNDNYKNLTITDATANVGGNTINFSKYFKRVNTIEIDPTTFDILKHNCVDVYKRRNISFYLGDCTKVIPKLKQDIIFFDPPWSGLMYKAYDKLDLSLGDLSMIDIIKEYYKKNNAKIYAYKCPANLNFDPFIKEFPLITMQKLKNYNIIYIINNSS